MLLTIKAKDQPDKLIDMPDEKVKSLRSDVMSAFNDTALGLADLADGKGDTFLEKFNKTYYDVYDPEHPGRKRSAISVSARACWFSPWGRI